MFHLWSIVEALIFIYLVWLVAKAIDTATENIKVAIRLSKDEVLRETAHILMLVKMSGWDKTTPPNPTFFRSVSEQEKAERILSVLMTPEERKEPYIPTEDQMVELRQIVAQKYGLPPFEVGCAAE